MPFVELKKSVPVLYALNLDEARLFYTGRLGFSYRYAYSSMLSVERGDVEIQIRRVQEEIAPTVCRINVEGIKDLFEEYFLKEIVDSGEFIRESQTGEREFKVIDLYGNVLVFAESGVMRKIGESEREYCFAMQRPFAITRSQRKRTNTEIAKPTPQTQ